MDVGAGKERKWEAKEAHGVYHSLQQGLPVQPKVEQTQPANRKVVNVFTVGPDEQEFSQNVKMFVVRHHLRLACTFNQVFC